MKYLGRTARWAVERAILGGGTGSCGRGADAAVKNDAGDAPDPRMHRGLTAMVPQLW
jgi:hypothetical protein